MSTGTIEERLSLLEQKVARLTGQETQEPTLTSGSLGAGVPELQSTPQTLEERIQAWLNRSPEEIEAARAEVLAASRPPRPLPPGKTLEDVIVGQIPGDETEEELIAMLKDL